MCLLKKNKSVGSLNAGNSVRGFASLKTIYLLKISQKKWFHFESYLQFKGIFSCKASWYLNFFKSKCANILLFLKFFLSTIHIHAFNLFIYILTEQFAPLKLTGICFVFFSLFFTFVVRSFQFSSFRWKCSWQTDWRNRRWSKQRRRKRNRFGSNGKRWYSHW